MQKATPIQMRESLQIVDELKRAGIRFVPMPVVDDADFMDRMIEVTYKLDEIEKIANQSVESDGEKRCPSCELYIDKNADKCGVCGLRLRRSSVNRYALVKGD